MSETSPVGGASGVWSYRVGPWFAVFGSEVTVLLPESQKDRMIQLWSLVDGGEGFDEVLDGLLASGLRTLPGFVLVSGAAADPTRVLLRGQDVVATLRTGTEDVVIDGGEGGTWAERSVEGVTALTVTLPTDGSGAGEGTLDFPITTGLVRVGRIDRPACVVPTAAPVASEPAQVAGDAGAEYDGDPLGAAVAPLAVPLPDAAAALETPNVPEEMPSAGVDMPEAHVAEPDVAEPDVAEPDVAEPDVAEPDVAEPGPLDAVTEASVPPDADATETTTMDAAAGPAEPAVPAELAEPDAEAPELAPLDEGGPAAEATDAAEQEAPLPPPPSETPYGWMTPWGTAPEAEDSAEFGESDEALAEPEVVESEVAESEVVEPEVVEPEVTDVEGHADAGFQDAGAGFASAAELPAVPDLPPPSGEPADDAPPPPGAWDAAFPPPPTPGAADHDGQTNIGGDSPDLYRQQPGIPGQPQAPAVTAPVAKLLISDGQKLVVDRVILIGRAPEARRFTSTEQPTLVTVPSRLHEISSTHVEVRPGAGADHGTAVVTDMGSTNGTVLVQPGLGPEDLKPGIAVQLIPGAIINLGDGITIQVTRP